jgi:hypothetical protein
VNITTAGTYNAGFRVASSHADSSVEMYVDGWATPVSTPQFVLKFPTDFVNINWINFAPMG